MKSPSTTEAPVRDPSARPVITNIQILRFFAAAAILVTHSALLVPRSGLFAHFPWVGGVDLFFVISGFIMMWLTWGRFGESGAASRFLLRRMIRIVPPYWFFTTLMVAAVLLASRHIRNTTLEAAPVVTSYAFLPWPRPSDGKLNPILSQGWTLNYEMFFYAAFAAALCLRNGLRWLVLAFILLAALHYAVPDDWFVLKFYTDPIILEFLVGIGIAHIYMRGVQVPLWGSVALAGLAVLAFEAARLLPHFDGDRALTLGLPASLLFLSLALRPEPPRQGPVRRFLRLGGDASYTLYLSHTFTATAMAIAWRRLGFEDPWLELAVAIVAGIAVALLLYHFLERPATDALSRAADLSRPKEAERVAP
ncbi:MAG TPA: acyltransferase [Allosphingosinicella sp.]